MSMQGALDNAINGMREEEAKEALMDIVLVLSNAVSSKEEKYDLLMEICKERIFDKYLK